MIVNREILNSGVNRLKLYACSVKSNIIDNKANKFCCSAGQQSVIFSLLTLGAIGAALGGCSSPSPSNNNLQAQQTPASPAASTSPNQSQSNNPPLPSENSNFVVAAVQKVGPAVVRIDSTRTITAQAPAGFNDPFFRQFFGFGQQPHKEIVRGIGSGFIINPNGQILTNAHVVNGVSTVTVTLKNGQIFKGKVLGEDPVTDVAVVKIPANNLPAVTLGNSSQLQPGDSAIAIGNPLGLDNTVTSGIISATNRASAQIGISHDPVNFIQTDAAINPGNSGGPLLNAQGQVIGINTAIIQGSQGIGFAIPINTAESIAKQLVTNGKVEHPFLGVEMATLTPELKQQLSNALGGQLNITANQGVIIVHVLPNSPAAQAGLQPGDVIQKINNQPVTTSEEVQRIVENTKVGSQLQMQVQRQGRSIQVSVRTVPLPPQLAQPQG
ncbi:MAG: trypsin-like peptidase domain-containing protein [Chroococcidiopsidaceae cyanobacterium CP_BM_ER_R8_30]|nr:trypsin-like peptidase domain-containing protein [Chroococcidiopsidaceae cyanobacterium CP_BM_ER_R8_30]